MNGIEINLILVEVVAHFDSSCHASDLANFQVEYILD